MKVLLGPHPGCLQEERALRHETFGPLTPISRDQYREIYANTGLDIDGRGATAARAFLPRFKPLLHGMVALAHALPKFKLLPLEDQTALLKGAARRHAHTDTGTRTHTHNHTRIHTHTYMSTHARTCTRTLPLYLQHKHKRNAQNQHTHANRDHTQLKLVYPL